MMTRYGKITLPKAHHSSNYAAHLGKHKDFEAKMAVLLDGYEARPITGKAQQQAKKNYSTTIRPMPIVCTVRGIASGGCRLVRELSRQLIVE